MRGQRASETRDAVCEYRPLYGPSAAKESPQVTDEFRLLIARCMAGDQPAMLDLVERFRGQVFGLCFRMLGHRQDAEDAAQETFVRVLKNLHQWDAERDFEPWLLAIAGNRCRTALAKRLRQPPPRSLTEPVPAPAMDEQAARQLTEEVELALSRLREQYRQAFVLFHQQEFSYAQIAAILACPIGTVRTWIHRARRELIGHLRAREVTESRHAV